MRRDALYLSDVVEAAEAIERFLNGTSEAEFLTDEMRQSAVLQKLMIIGEATTRLSTELKASTQDVPRSQIAGFRNIAVHAYFNVDWSIVMNIGASAPISLF